MTEEARIKELERKYKKEASRKDSTESGKTIDTFQPPSDPVSEFRPLFRRANTWYDREGNEQKTPGPSSETYVDRVVFAWWIVWWFT